MRASLGSPLAGRLGSSLAGRLGSTLAASLCALVLLALAPGCVTATVGLTAAVASQDFIEHSAVAYVKHPSEQVWEQAKATLGRLSLDPLELDEELRAARCNIDGARVTVHVETSGVNESKIAVGARKWGFTNEGAANDVLERIKDEVARGSGAQPRTR